MLPTHFPKLALVAHRGLATHYPENTWLALEQAILAEARVIEFDIQLSSDHVPVVIHDETLARTCGVVGKVGDFTAAELTALSCGYADRFAETFADITIDRLDTVVQQFSSYPDAFLLAELKEESVARFGLQVCMRGVYEALEPVRDRTCIISFASEVVTDARAHGWSTGWCVDDYDESSRAVADRVRPDMLLVDEVNLHSPADLWPGDWQWAAWEVVDPVRAAALMRLGVHHVETYDCAALAADPAVQAALKQA